MRQLAQGRQEALGPLYSRYAPLVFSLAARALDRAAAEEIVQDVFLQVWRKAGEFRTEVGDFRPWVTQIARYRVINELRRRRRRPQAEPDPEGLLLEGLADPGPEPDEAAWRELRRSALKSALAELPPPQRQALGLAFFEELTHEEIAATLNLPLGTAKTRIRAGLQKLRGRLAPLAAAGALAAILGLAGQRYYAASVTLHRYQRALTLVTTSDVEPLRLEAMPGVPPEAHGQYRGRRGADLAVLTLSNVPPPPAGHAYQAWVRTDAGWASLGTVTPDVTGRALLIAESPRLAGTPLTIEVTLEPVAGSPTPTGPAVIRWDQ